MKTSCWGLCPKNLEYTHFMLPRSFLPMVVWMTKRCHSTFLVIQSEAKTSCWGLCPKNLDYTHFMLPRSFLPMVVWMTKRCHSTFLVIQSEAKTSCWGLCPKNLEYTHFMHSDPSSHSGWQNGLSWWHFLTPKKHKKHPKTFGNQPNNSYLYNVKKTTRQTQFIYKPLKNDKAYDWLFSIGKTESAWPWSSS